MDGPEYGPGGYLPGKAAKRARKIILREQMGWGWPLAAAAAAIVVAIAGGVYLYVSSRGPAAPFVETVPVDRVAPNHAEIIHPPSVPRTALFVKVGGAVRAFHPPRDPAVVWCADTRRLEADDTAWSIDGRLTHGDGDSLQPLRTVVSGGVVFVDFTTQLPRPAPAPGGPPPSCAATG